MDQSLEPFDRSLHAIESGYLMDSNRVEVSSSSLLYYELRYKRRRFPGADSGQGGPVKTID